MPSIWPATTAATGHPLLENPEGIKRTSSFGKGAVKEIIQAAYSIEDDKTKKREIRSDGLRRGAFGLKNGTIITRGVEQVENIWRQGAVRAF